ncbi:uncharacterized protein [Montipora foliosa]|uniref:uncharacterized protein n=1 Tax=Montipora foliosa TaxID=591990 RepID=UPI0035F1098C
MTGLPVLKSKIKSAQLIHIGRFIFFAMLMTQCGFLTAYPAWYKQDARWIPVFLLYAPAVSYWIGCLLTQAKLVRMFFTWFLYVVIALIPMIATIFAVVVVGDDLNTKNLLGPNALKVMLCLTPLLFLLLVNTASDSDDEHKGYSSLVQRLSLQITIDLFDTVEMLDIALDEREDNHRTIPKGFAIAMVAVACFSFLLSLFQLAENKLEKGKHTRRDRTAIIRNVMQIFFVNSPFFFIRLIVFIQYKKDESIFMAKNGIAIFLSGLEIYWVRKKLSQVSQVPQPSSNV